MPNLRRSLSLSTALALTTLALGTLQPASAHDGDRDGPRSYRARDEIREDVNRMQRDRQILQADEARLNRERAEVEAARIHEREALRRGDIAGVARAYEQEQRETRELSAAQNKVNADRAKLARDRGELHREIQEHHHHRRFWWWG